MLPIFEEAKKKKRITVRAAQFAIMLCFGEFSFHSREKILPQISARNPQYPGWPNPFRPRSTALHMGFMKAGAHGYNICASLRPHHTCGDGVCRCGITILFLCFVLPLWFDLIFTCWEGYLFHSSTLRSGARHKVRGP